MTPQPDVNQDEGSTAVATPVSNEQLYEMLRKIYRRVKKLEVKIGEVPPTVNLSDWISEAFQQISNLEDKENELVDEAVERATRAQRAVRRLQKDYEAHTHEEEES